MARHHFEELASLSGDLGARHIIGENAYEVIEVARYILFDFDTPEALANRRERDTGFALIKETDLLNLFTNTSYQDRPQGEMIAARCRLKLMMFILVTRLAKIW